MSLLAKPSFALSGADSQGEGLALSPSRARHPAAAFSGFSGLGPSPFPHLLRLRRCTRTDFVGEFPGFFLFLLCTLFILCSDPIAARRDSHIHLFLMGISHMRKHLRCWCFLIACLGTEAADPFGAGLDWEGSNITSRCLRLQELAS